MYVGNVCILIFSPVPFIPIITVDITVGENGGQAGKEQEGIFAGIFLLLFMTPNTVANTHYYNYILTHIYNCGHTPIFQKGRKEDMKVTATPTSQGAGKGRRQER